MNKEKVLYICASDAKSIECQEAFDCLRPLGENLYNPFIQFTSISQITTNILHDNLDSLGYSKELPPPKLLDKMDMTFFLVSRSNIMSSLNKYKIKANSPFVVANEIIDNFLTLSSFGIDSFAYRHYVNELKDKIGFIEESSFDSFQELADMYSFYESAKIKENIVDFADSALLSLRCARLFPFSVSPPVCFTSYQYIVIDGIEALSMTQLKLVQHISLIQSASLIMITDSPLASRLIKWLPENDEQSPFLSLLQSYFPNAKIEINDINFQTYSKERKFINDILLTSYTSISEEAKAVADTIKNIIQTNPNLTSLSQIAVISRSKADCDFFDIILQSQGIPTNKIPSPSLFNKMEVINIVNMLKVLAYPYDNQALYKLMTQSSRWDYYYCYYYCHCCSC